MSGTNDDGYGQIVSTGSIAFAGQLKVSLDDPTVLAAGDELSIVKYASRTGQFDEIDSGNISVDTQFESDMLRVIVS